MNLSELLQELRENILYDRSDRVAGADPFLWSDATLVRYINEAQRRFARKSLIIRDGTSTDATLITLRDGVTEYALHPSVMGVLSARFAGDLADLARAGHSPLGTYHQPDTYFFDPASLSSLQPGKPLAFTTDEYLGVDDNDSVSVVTLKVYPAPTADQDGETIRLRVVRLPLEPLTINNLYAAPEIPEDHHLEMLDWAAYLALRIVDVDAGNANRAAEFRASFDLHVKAARDNVMRKLFTPLQWGFGRNGFTWEK